MKNPCVVHRICRPLSVIALAWSLGFPAFAGEVVRIGEPSLVLEGRTLSDVMANAVVGQRVGGCLLAGEIWACNVTVVAREGDRPVKLRAEFQAVDGGFLKCVVVEFTEGWGGVWAAAVAWRYTEVPEGGVGSVRFANPDGTYAGKGYHPALNESDRGYGVGDLQIVPALWSLPIF